MKDFLDNEINIGDTVIVSAYGDPRKLLKAKVDSLKLHRGFEYVLVRFILESGDLSEYPDPIPAEYVVVVNALIKNKTQKGIFDL